MGQKEDDARDVAAGVRDDMASAHQHHLLVHLVLLAVHLDQVEFGDVTNTEALMERTGGSCHHPAPSQLIPPLAFGSPSYRHVVRSCVRGEKCVRVSAKATLARLPDFGVFLAPLRLVVRGRQLPSDM